LRHTSSTRLPCLSWPFGKKYDLGPSWCFQCNWRYAYRKSSYVACSLCIGLLFCASRGKIFWIGKNRKRSINWL